MNKNLQSLRTEIDQLDEQLWKIIGQREDLVRQIGAQKQLLGEPIVQTERWQQVMQHCLSIARQYGISDECVNEVMQAIHKESVRIES